MSGLFTRLDASPYESHGWTAFGFLGIIGVATYNEIPEAKDWLKIIIPAYTSMLPPWSYQDGGWCQGTDYWQYSTMTNHEFMDVLVLLDDRAPSEFQGFDVPVCGSLAHVKTFCQFRGSVVNVAAEHLKHSEDSVNTSVFHM
jgi:hypothetical protein